MVSGFLREVDENGTLMGYYAADSGYLTTTHCIITEKSAVLNILHELKQIPHSVVNRLQEIIIQFPAGAVDFFVLGSIQTGSFDPPTLLLSWYQGVFPRASGPR